MKHYPSHYVLDSGPGDVFVRSILTDETYVIADGALGKRPSRFSPGDFVIPEFQGSSVDPDQKVVIKLRKIRNQRKHYELF